MKKMMRIILGLFVLGFTLSASAKDSIKIGALVAATGPASFLGDPELKTLELYVEKINAAGGVLGKKLELVAYDTGANPKKATTFVKRLINQDEVVAIMGGSASGETMAILPFIKKAKIPLVSMAGSIKIVQPVKKYVFKTPATDRMACQKIFAYLKSKGQTNIALISGNGGFGKSMRGQCKDVAGDYGIKIVADETYGPKDTDMTSQLTKIKSMSNVQAVVNPGFGQGPAIVTKNFKQLGMTQALVQSHGVASKKFIELTGAAGEGVIVASPPVVVASLLEDSNPIKKIAMDYIKEYEGKYNAPVSTFGGYAYDALNLIVDAMKKANSAEPKAIRDAIESTTGYVGLNGMFNMSKKDHLGLDIDSGIKMLEIKNGDWILAK
ncbi:ABC transporter substrate-binding protein [Arcobacter sp. LA11]|uniref:ABC transporter substrate-binding protein n=1 Tax=Arcobacter sp. LA11 TaxID=1898176 RepID=UPI0009351717|nr:ABC transporter substrate-binding protein [Arcobacter sp. LA11]